MTTPPYELSAAYMNGLVQAARDLGIYEGASTSLSPEVQAAYERGALRPWWDAQFFERLVTAVFQVYGERQVEELGYRVVADAVGPLILPRMRELLAAPDAGPQTLFAHVEQFIVAAVRPIAAHWAPGDGPRGTLELRYPGPLRPELAALWRGAVRYVFETARREGRIVREQLSAPEGRLAFDVEWPA